MFHRMIALRPVIAAVAISTALLATGCATTVPKAQFSQSMPVEARVGAADKTSATVTAASGVTLADYERSRMKEKIESAINARKASNPGIANREVLVEVQIVRYEKGNAFARAMLAGLGQIHVDGKITVYTMPEHAQIASFTLNKTFAWGGLYGAITTMDEIEQTFAEGVAASVTGGDPDAAKK